MAKPEYLQLEGMRRERELRQITLPVLSTAIGYYQANLLNRKLIVRSHVDTVSELHQLRLADSRLRD